MATADREENEWELVNDDGFVYKLKKRPRLDPTTTSSAPPLPDSAAEENYRRERNKRALVKLREKYQQEIGQWEHLSNMLCVLQQGAKNQQLQEHMTMSYDLPVCMPQPPELSSDSGGRQLLDDLLFRAEAEEVIIQDASNLCDMAEAVCNVQEKLTKQPLVDLPIWASPRELMASLCDE